MRKLFKTIRERLIEKIAVDDNGCWVWLGARFRKQYGHYSQIRIGGKKGKCRKAHQISYEEFVGQIPKGTELDHLCKNTLCINPQHLEPVTHKVNMSRAKHIIKTHCVHGHKRTSENIYVNPKGSKECLICMKLRRIKFKEKKTGGQKN